MEINKSCFPGETTFLITGGAGFIGSNIAETLLSIGVKVRVLDNFMTGKRENISEFMNHPNFELIEGDIRDIDVCQCACKNITYVLHQAALGSVPRSIHDPITSNDINVSGMLNMLVAARDNKVCKFVYASSSSVYGDEPNLPKIEGREGKPLSPYAITKKVNELYAKVFYDIYGLNTIGLRYFNVFGKKQDPNSVYAAVIPIFIRKLMKNESPVINGDGTQSRDFTHVDNVVQANIKACLSERNADGQVFNIAYGGRVTLLELYYCIAKLLDKEIEPNFGSMRTGDILHSNADVSLAKENFEYTPEIDLNEGLRRTIAWYKNQLSSN